MLRYLYLIIFLLHISEIFALTDKYRCTLRDDPATTIVIAWNQISGNNPVVYFDTIDYGTNASSYAFSHSVDRISLAKNMNNNFARLTGLQPNTVYYFIIQDDNSVSPRFSFKTSSNLPTERLSFIAGGDSRNNIISRQNANKIVAKTRPNAVLFGGDMINIDNDLFTNHEWEQWFDDWQFTIGQDGRMTPILATRGNHENSNLSIYNLFDTPNPDVYYAITFGGNLFRAYTLNTMIAVNGTQKTWLENDLIANNQVCWKSAQYHHPMRPHVSYKAENTHLVTHWAPLFEQHGLDFAIECDAHTVKTTYPIRTSNAPGSQEGFIRDDTNGVVYVGEGCWGAPLRPNDDDKSWTRHSGSFNQVKWIFINQQKIEIRTVKTDNANSVGYLDDTNRFAMPSNINIWTPALYQDVISIEKPIQPLHKLILCNPLDNQLYMNIQPIALQALMFDSLFFTAYVEFSVNGTTVGVDSTAPYALNWTPPSSGHYQIRATAFNNSHSFVTSNTVHIDVYAAPTTTTLSSPITASLDDAEEYSTGIVDLDNSNLHFAINQTTQTLGLRFRAIDLPKSAQINYAYIQFTASEQRAKHCNFKIKIQDDVNPSPFGMGYNNITSRPTFPMEITWSPPTWFAGDAGLDQQSPDLSSLIQAIITKEDWYAGNPLVFVLDGFGHRTAVSADALTNNAPILYINYTINPPPIISPTVNDLTFCLGAGGPLTLIGSSGYPFYYWEHQLDSNQNNYYNVSTSGDYVLRVMDIYGQVASDTAHVLAHTPPFPDLGPNLTLNGGSVNLSTPNSYPNYFWNTGETSASINTNLVGMYTLTVIDSNGCMGSDTIEVMYNVAVPSINNSVPQLKIYPNPANRFLTIEIDHSTLLLPSKVELWDYLGQKHISANWNTAQNELSIDISSLPNGYYYLNIIDPLSNTQAFPVLIQH